MNRIQKFYLRRFTEGTPFIYLEKNNFTREPTIWEKQNDVFIPKKVLSDNQDIPLHSRGGGFYSMSSDGMAVGGLLSYPFIVDTTNGNYHHLFDRSYSPEDLTTCSSENPSIPCLDGDCIQCVSSGVAKGISGDSSKIVGQVFFQVEYEVLDIPVIWLKEDGIYKRYFLNQGVQNPEDFQFENSGIVETFTESGSFAMGYLRNLSDNSAIWTDLEKKNSNGTVGTLHTLRDPADINKGIFMNGGLLDMTDPGVGVGDATFPETGRHAMITFYKPASLVKFQAEDFTEWLKARGFTDEELYLTPEVPKLNSVRLVTYKHGYLHFLVTNPLNYDIPTLYIRVKWDGLKSDKGAIRGSLFDYASSVENKLERAFVYIDSNDNGLYDEGEIKSEVVNGSYEFLGLDFGDYTVRVSEVEGKECVEPSSSSYHVVLSENNFEYVGDFYFRDVGYAEIELDEGECGVQYIPPLAQIAFRWESVKSEGFLGVKLLKTVDGGDTWEEVLYEEEENSILYTSIELRNTTLFYTGLLGFKLVSVYEGGESLGVDVFYNSNRKRVRSEVPEGIIVRGRRDIPGVSSFYRGKKEGYLDLRNFVIWELEEPCVGYFELESYDSYNKLLRSERINCTSNEFYMHSIKDVRSKHFRLRSRGEYDELSVCGSRTYKESISRWHLLEFSGEASGPDVELVGLYNENSLLKEFGGKYYSVKGEEKGVSYLKTLKVMWGSEEDLFETYVEIREKGTGAVLYRSDRFALEFKSGNYSYMLINSNYEYGKEYEVCVEGYNFGGYVSTSCRNLVIGGELGEIYPASKNRF